MPSVWARHAARLGKSPACEPTRPNSPLILLGQHTLISYQTLNHQSSGTGLGSLNSPWVPYHTLYQWSVYYTTHYISGQVSRFPPPAEWWHRTNNSIDTLWPGDWYTLTKDRYTPTRHGYTPTTVNTGNASHVRPFPCPPLPMSARHVRPSPTPPVISAPRQPPMLERGPGTLT